MPGQPLSTFIQAVKSGLARTNRFTVIIGGSVPFLSLMCESTSLPGLSYGSQGVRVFGETREVVYDRIFDPITLTFYVDAGMEVKYFFDEWMGNIVDSTTRSTSYYDSYVKDIDIIVHDTVNDDTYKVSLYEAFPKSVGAIQMDNNSRDVMKMTVTFQYRYHINTQFIKSTNRQTSITVETPEGVEDLTTTYEDQGIFEFSGPGIDSSVGDTGNDFWP
jgi:hypothetical protein